MTMKDRTCTAQILLTRVCLSRQVTRVEAAKSVLSATSNAIALRYFPRQRLNPKTRTVMTIATTHTVDKNEERRNK